MKQANWIPYIIISLAIIGFLSMIIVNPIGLLKSLFSLIIIGAIIFGLIHLLLNRNHTNHNEMKKYRKALKQSKRRYQNYSTAKSLRRPKTKTVRKRRRPTHLRVIEGKKSKNNNHISF